MHESSFSVFDGAAAPGLFRTIRFAVVLLVAGSVVISLAAEMTANPSPALRRIQQPGPLVIGHRGFSARAPENTLPSFRQALAARADLVELDFHATADGALVVLHDGTLDRTTDAIARWGGKEHSVSRRRLDELAGLDAGRWFGASYAGTRIPTLAEAVETIQRGGCTLIERKGGSADALVSLLRKRNWLETVVVQSFDWEFVKQARALAPQLVLGALGPPSSWHGRRLTDPEKALNPEFLDAVVQTGSQLVVWNAMVDTASIREAHDRGLRIWIYTIDDPVEAARLVREGVDGIITNDPEVVRAQLLPAPDEARVPVPGRGTPRPLADHPGNIYLEGETVRVRLPDGLPAAATHWRVRTDRSATVRSGSISLAASGAPGAIDLGRLGIGWYRIEFGTPEQPDLAFTTAAVLRPLDAPVPGDSPIAVDAAISWFARNDPLRQRQFANLAALAGVNWIRDRLRWSDLQPAAGPFVSGPTTYDTAAEAQQAAGLKVLQVFHDTPRWARESEDASGRFAPDLRHAHALGRALAERFRGRVAAWEPWNEANVATFGGHTVDQMCSWQKAFWLGCKRGDPEVTVGWNATAAVPTSTHTEGVLANETWPYYDTYNIHTYDWAHAYADLWAPAREATAGRPLWITEADRGTPHRQQAPWYDQDPRLEQLKAEWIPQSYASSLFSGSRRHFHFILGHYHEPNAIQFGLLRLDLTPRPGYVALAAVGRCLAGARALGRWQPRETVNVYAFRAWPDGQEHDVLVVWAEKEVDWNARGKTTADWALPTNLVVRAVVDHLGRSLGATLPAPVTSAPGFVFLPPGQATTLPLEPPPTLPSPRPGQTSPVVLQFSLPPTAIMRVEDRPWSEGYAYRAKAGETLELPVHVYNFGDEPARGSLRIKSRPEEWETAIPEGTATTESMDRTTRMVSIRIPVSATVRDGWVVLEGEFGVQGRPVVAARVRVAPP